jgi:beta-glucanase (GH16 family)
MFYSLQDDFHLYTMIWNENAIRMYLDLDKNPEAEPYYEMLIDSREGEYAVADYFHKPFFIIFNLAVGGDFPQIYTIEEITALNPQNHYQARMYIDYVNVYDLDGHLIWQDAFDGETLDESHWNIEVNDDGGGNHELQSYRRQNVSVETDPASGKCCLILTASQDGR